MSILQSVIEDLAITELVNFITIRITDLLEKSGIKLGQGNLAFDYINGTVTVDSKFTFTMTDNQLRMMVPCPKCAMDVPSTPIRSLADIAMQSKEPKPAKHVCMDV